MTPVPGPPEDPEATAGVYVVLLAAAREMDGLIAALEPTLDAYQRRLLHRIRLAAESLALARAAARLRADPILDRHPTGDT